MTIAINVNERGIFVTGDELALMKAEVENGVIPQEKLSIEGLGVNAETLVKLYNKAVTTGPYMEDNVVIGFPAAKKYAAMKELFLKLEVGV